MENKHLLICSKQRDKRVWLLKFIRFSIAVSNQVVFCLLITWNKFHFWVLPEKPWQLAPCSRVLRILRELSSRTFFFLLQLWILFLREQIVAEFQNRKNGMKWLHFFCFYLYWLEVLSDENERFHNHCNRHNYLRLFQTKFLGILLFRLEIFCSNCEDVFWSLLTVFNPNASEKSIDLFLEGGALRITVSSEDNNNLAFFQSIRFKYVSFEKNCGTVVRWLKASDHDFS